MRHSGDSPNGIPRREPPGPRIRYGCVGTASNHKNIRLLTTTSATRFANEGHLCWSTAGRSRTFQVSGHFTRAKYLPCANSKTANPKVIQAQNMNATNGRCPIAEPKLQSSAPKIYLATWTAAYTRSTSGKLFNNVNRYSGNSAGPINDCC